MADPIEVPTSVPVEVMAGLTWRFDISSLDYLPSDGWSCDIVWNGPGPRIAKTGVANSEADGWEFTINATENEGATSGLYFWTMYVTNGTSKYVVGNGSTYVLANPITAAPGSMQLWAERALVYVEAALMSRYQIDMAQMMLKQRQHIREEITKLEAARAKLKAEIAALRSSDGSLGRPVMFTPTSYL